MTGTNATLKQQCERLSAAQESLKASREAWQEERQRLADLLTEVQQGSQAVQQRHEAEIVALRSDIEKACAGQREAEEQLSKARAAQLGRLQEAFEKEPVAVGAAEAVPGGAAGGARDAGSEVSFRRAR